MKHANGESMGLYVQMRVKGQKRGSKGVTLDWLTITEVKTMLRSANVRACRRVQRLIKKADAA